MRSPADKVAGYEGSKVGAKDPKTKAKEIGLDKNGKPKSEDHHAVFSCRRYSQK